MGEYATVRYRSQSRQIILPPANHPHNQTLQKVYVPIREVQKKTPKFSIKSQAHQPSCTHPRHTEFLRSQLTRCSIRLIAISNNYRINSNKLASATSQFESSALWLSMLNLHEAKCTPQGPLNGSVLGVFGLVQCG